MIQNQREAKAAGVAYVSAELWSPGGRGLDISGPYSRKKFKEIVALLTANDPDLDAELGKKAPAPTKGPRAGKGHGADASVAHGESET